MDIQALRNDTPGCKNVVHFNNAGASLMPQQVLKAVQDYLETEAGYGGYETAAKYQERINQFYDAGARLLHCQPRNIAFTTNATDSYIKALSSIPLQKDDVVLLTKNDYSSNFISLLSLRERTGIRLIEINNSASGELDLNDLEEKIRKYQPKLLSVTHIPTSSGLVQPVDEIGQLVKQHDIFYLLDACQSIGQLDVDAISTHADFICGTSRKFLRGPRGGGILYVSDKALERKLTPLYPDLGAALWTSRDTYEVLKDAKRFELWEKSYALIMGSIAAIEYATNIGLNNIWQRNQELVALLRKELTAAGMTLQDKGQIHSAIITFTLPVQASGDTLKKYLNERGINISITPKSSAVIDFEEKNIDWAARVSPHYYNTEEEIHILIDALRSFNKLS
ncbi:Selenocysteine lyase/Cysteine desulfurase [Chitinophaga terrae (ex Kim and Jung 2007)]|uniref:Selenocysteine lyase/Cysteine desulfurase n=1 Tax=Chitinophaga terrae (ex Kim and Jung 2007) TaxID=408074 RepID=A0A1H4GGQ0_9BACT|nr:aminotransferase class V-fold PLP-dependent enzyme [Chitinophaga terrae (ex Kim and Jung 2007)]GEP93415.1 aminotransferase class V [Chitinophaga terrae (ex Kim and Jung 2007)]SEB08441.1 Selenocysteine lyase/Cysteine desulfurase [Chitinophaga terrae (ex Kim and Jung 2007)]